MHPRVRQLYKDLIFTAQLYAHQPLPVARERIKKHFFNNRNMEVESTEFKKALAWGKYEIKNMKVVHEIKQFRAMKGRYEATDQQSQFETPWSELTKPVETLVRDGNDATKGQ